MGRPRPRYSIGHLLADDDKIEKKIRKKKCLVKIIFRHTPFFPKE